MGIVMKAYLILFIIMYGVLFFPTGCTGEVEIHPPKERLPGGQAVMKSYVDPDYVGKTIIPDEIKYPGMDKFDETAAIDFISEDAPEEVAKWFEENHEATVVKRDLRAGDYKWEVSLENWDIDIFAYESVKSHLRYKRHID